MHMFCHSVSSSGGSTAVMMPFQMLRDLQYGLSAKAAFWHTSVCTCVTAPAAIASNSLRVCSCGLAARWLLIRCDAWHELDVQMREADLGPLWQAQHFSNSLSAFCTALPGSKLPRLEQAAVTLSMSVEVAWLSSC